MWHGVLLNRAQENADGYWLFARFAANIRE
jgi:hypothetical protein